MKVLRGRTAFITGAASGIGRAIAVRLAREGVHLVITDRDAPGLAATEQAARDTGVNVTTLTCDLSRPADITKALAETFAARPLHILVNCAGVTWYGHHHTTTEAEWRNVMAVNLMAPIQITTELMPMLLSADEAHVVNVASMLGVIPGRKLAAYSASKYGLVGFTLALRSEYVRRGFGLSVICPGFVTTPMLALESMAKDRAKRPVIPTWLTTTPDHVAAVAIDAIKRDRGLVVVTFAAKLLWRLTRLMPALIDYLNREGWRSRGRILPSEKDRAG